MWAGGSWGREEAQAVGLDSGVVTGPENTSEGELPGTGQWQGSQALLDLGGHVSPAPETASGVAREATGSSDVGLGGQHRCPGPEAVTAQKLGRLAPRGAGGKGTA